MDELRNSIERSILDLTNKGKTARLYVDATREGVEVPEHVRTQWGEGLLIDLNPAWPIQLDFDDQALYADLGFQGELMRCRFPFRAVWAVMDFAAGSGFVFKENVPPTLAAQIQSGATLAPAPVAPEAERTPEREAPPATPATRAPRSKKPAAAASPRRNAPHLKLVKGGKG